MARQNSRSVSYCVTFGQSLLMLFELSVLIAFGVVAGLLRFTFYFPVHRQEFNCDDKSISFPYPASTNCTSNGLITLNLHCTYDENLLLSLAIIVPLVLIAIVQFLDGILNINLQDKCKSLQNWMQISGTFLAGVFASSVIADLLKLSIGRLTPYFLSVCGNACTNTSIVFTDENDQQDELEYCTGNVNDTWITAKIIREARGSFPSSDLVIVSFVTMFVVIYLSRKIIHNWLRTIKSCICFVLIVKLFTFTGYLYVTKSNHIEDLLFSVFLGTLIAVYVCFVHLNAFEDEFDDDYYLTDEERYLLSTFHIPRVVYRGSKRWKNTERTDLNGTVSTMMTNTGAGGVINPAFRSDIDETRLGSKFPSNNKLY